MQDRGGVRSEAAVKKYGIVSALLTSFCITIPVLLILAAVLTFTDFPEKYVTVAVLLATLTGLFYAGYKSGMYREKNGMLQGGLAGLLYMLILYAASSILLKDFKLNQQVIIMMLTGILAGAIGGIISMNRKAKPRQSRIGRGKDLLKKYRK